jgi:septum site-determining protein MinC
MNALTPEKPAVRLTGMGSSLCVRLDPAEPLDQLREELRRRFARIKDLSPATRVLIDAGAPDGYEDVIEALSDFLRDAFGIESVARLPERKPPPPDEGAEHRPAGDMEQQWRHQASDVLLLTGRVRSGQRITAPHHLVILGDVNPGAEVMAGGDILVFGGLLGTAIAGQPDNEDGIVLALDFRPTQVQIAGYVAAGLPASPGRVPEFAHVEGGQIVVENYLEANPFGRLPWPRVR